MGPKTVAFFTEERLNCFAKNGKEWALYAYFDRDNKWTVHTWEIKPSKKAIQETIDIAMRAFEFYHRSLKIPRFELKIDKQK